MAFPSAIEALLRAGHIAAAVLWLGFLYFMVLVFPRIIAPMGEDMRRQVMPHMAKHVAPWMMWTATATIAFGALLYWDLGDRAGFGNISIGINLGVFLAFAMYGIGLVFVFPTSRQLARVLEGGKPPAMTAIQRSRVASMVNAVLGLFVLFFMVAAPRIPGLQ